MNKYLVKIAESSGSLNQDASHIGNWGAASSMVPVLPTRWLGTHMALKNVRPDATAGDSARMALRGFGRSIVEGVGGAVAGHAVGTAVGPAASRILSLAGGLAGTFHGSRASARNALKAYDKRKAEDADD